MSRASGLKAVAVVLVRLINSPATRSDYPGAVAEIDFLPLKHMDNTQPPAAPEAPTQTPEAAPSKPPVTKKDEVLGCGCLIIVALGLVMFLKSCFFSGGNTDAATDKQDVSMTTPRSDAANPAPVVENSDGGPSDEIIRRFSFAGPRNKFERGETMVSTGGKVPAGTLLFPVRSNPDPYGGLFRYYFFRDEFGDWRLLRHEGESKVQIFKPRKSAENATN